MSARSQVWEADVARAREFEKWDAEHREDAYYNRNDWRDRTVLKHLSAEFAAVRAEERKSWEKREAFLQSMIQGERDANTAARAEETVEAADVREIELRWADRIEAASRVGVETENKFAANGAYDSAAEAVAYRHGLERAAWLIRNRPDEDA